ncbi:glycosyltransferase [Thalassococcus sp. S3]|uniref:glycosyltransferase n=1 Tax=Thalassococcus sp. S3 TaxID=2017482 RepID=UPI0010245BDC|nr:glycosyltransferase [Thalassococcus sp. S3]QBF34077.1 glycosyl transferase [Thalassococcus sp. S3]
MHGDGTKLAITTNRPKARLLDLTRLIRRVGRVLTGVDRVELAYLVHLQKDPVPLYLIARTRLGYVLVGPDGAKALAERLTGDAAWGPPDLIELLGLGRRAEADLRRFACARAVPGRLRAMLARHLPDGFAYLNVGHSNLTERMLGAVQECGGRIAVLLHDAIPLDFPQFQRPGVPDAFRAKLQRVRRCADLILYNSEHSRDRAEAHMSAWGDVPDSAVVPLGIDVPRLDPGAVPAALDLSDPYFVTVGTIEPRKGHDLLLDVWDDLGEDAPRLFVCGARGWQNEAVFRRLDALGPATRVTELSDLPDGAVHSLVAGARALLCPSLAEGYGLPPLEALAVGTRPVCLELPIYRETMGDIPVYVKETDRYLWRNEIQRLMGAPKEQDSIEWRARFQPPSWDKHFNTVLTLT